MNSNLLDKNCPYCKTGFTETDDIVICGSCEMPHHKECWIENQGCTTFGCLGTIENLSNASPVDTSYYNLTVASDKVFCTQCGAENEGSSAFCAMCGNKLVAPVQSAPAPQATYTQPIAAPQPVYTQPAAPVYQQPVAPAYQQPVTPVYQQATTQTYQQPAAVYQQPVITQGLNQQSQVIDADLISFIRDKSTEYSFKFQKLKQSGSKVSWNWAAFLFGPMWFMYRKLYLYGIGLFVVNFVIMLVTGFPFFSLITSVVAGLLGNYIYMLELDKKLPQAKNLVEPAKTQYIQKNGGTSALASVLLLVGSFILSFMFSYM